MVHSTHSASQKITLNNYILKRNGVPLGHQKSLKNMLFRSLGAKDFATFWNYWNPIFGYYLGYFIFKPLKKFLPTTMAFVLTFIFCGALHDAVTSVVQGSLAFFFTPWFLFMSIGVVLSTILKLDFSKYSWLFRATMNIIYISTSLGLTIFLRIHGYLNII